MISRSTYKYIYWATSKTFKASGFCQIILVSSVFVFTREQKILRAVEHGFGASSIPGASLVVADRAFASFCGGPHSASLSPSHACAYVLTFARSLDGMSIFEARLTSNAVTPSVAASHI